MFFFRIFLTTESQRAPRLHRGQMKMENDIWKIDLALPSCGILVSRSLPEATFIQRREAMNLPMADSAELSIS
jgi:hypothetical protein